MINPELQNLSILVVEDEEKSWLTLRNVIEMWNGRALWVKTGMQAIEIIKQDKSIKIVLVDLNMPFMSGAETTRRIKAARPDVQVIALINLTEPALLSNSLEAGCSSYLIKPIDINKLKKVFHRETAIINAL